MARIKYILVAIGFVLLSALVAFGSFSISIWSIESIGSEPSDLIVFLLLLFLVIVIVWLLTPRLLRHFFGKAETDWL